MGFGDDLMGIGIARALSELPEYVAGTKFVFGDPDSFHDAASNTLKVHYTEVMINHPLLLAPGEPVNDICCIDDYLGHRQYVEYDKCETRDEDGQRYIERFQWNEKYQSRKGEIWFDQNEKSAASEIAMRLPYPYFVIEPNVAKKAWFNHKSWPFDKWQDVVDALPEVRFIQFNGERVLNGVHQLTTPSFRQATAILACSGGFIGTDGGLHHAAAALDVPAIVLWGHYSSPEVFGYTDQTNIRHETGLGCGYAWKECGECNSAMLKITVDEVVDAIKGLINDGRDKVSRKGADRPIFRMVGSASEGTKK